MPSSDNFRAYVISDPLYYDRIERADGADEVYERLASRVAPVDLMGIWARCLPIPVDQLPAFGWKLHVSARPDQVMAVLDDVIDEFEVEPFSFKCIRSIGLATAQLSRWWPRGGAGKAFAMYPTSPQHAQSLAERLTKRLVAYDGAHILTDRRFPGSQVVQYRYGTFHKPDGVDADGRASSTVIGPDQQPWSDDRVPRFTLPPWITEDPFAVVEDLPRSDFLRKYQVTAALRQSTAGGVYAARTADGAEVVLKECRPNTAFTPAGTDAVARLHQEHAYLTRLSGTGIAPEPIELVQVWEHTFLVESRVPGITMQAWISRNHPFVQGFTDSEHVRRYRSSVAELMRQLRRALTICLDQAILYGDVSLTNILIDDDGTLRLVDLEGGRDLDQDPADHPRTSGFAPEPGTRSWSTDQAWLDYTVAAVEAACISSRNSLMSLDPKVFYRSLQHTADELSWPIDDLLGRLSQGIRAVRPEPTTEPGLAAVVAGIADHLNHVATPQRRDRLFPAQPELFATNPLGLAHGAAGVLRTLHIISGEVDPAQVRWLLDWLDRDPQLAPGLFYGRAGIGLSLLELGEVDRGLAEIDTAAQQVFAGFERPDVATGLSGIGLALLDAGSQRHDEATRIGEVLARTAEDDGTGLWWPTSREGARALGYGFGSSGIALFLCELADRTGQPRFAVLARRALAFDLSRGRIRDNGALGFGADAEARAFEPYLIRGGAGVGVATARLAQHLGDEQLVDVLRRMVAGIGQPFTVNPGLFSGMAGVAEFLLDARSVLTEPADRAVIDGYLRQLTGEILALRFEAGGALAFPGDGLLRLSCDHAGGSAGIALLFKRILDGTGSLDVRAVRTVR